MLLFSDPISQNINMSWNRHTIRQLRLRLGMTQAQLSRHLGCRQQTISEWEQGLYEPANAYGKLLDQLNLTAPPEPPADDVTASKLNLSKGQSVEKSEQISHLTQTALSRFDSFFKDGNDAVSFDPTLD